MNAQQLTPLVEAQALVIAGLEARIEALEARLEKALVWATTAQAHIQALEAKPAKKASDWVSGPRPSHPVRRPAALVASASSGIEWKDLPPEPLDDAVCNPSPVVPEDCPF